MFILPSEHLQSIHTIIAALPTILQGSSITVLLVFSSLSLGFILGLPMAILQVYAPTVVQFFVGCYVWFFRGVPVLLLLFLFYFGLFEFLDLNLSAITTSCIVLGMTSAAYQTQIFKGSLQTLPAGQLNAAKALGMNTQQAIFFIILPQALRRSLPGWSNEYSILLKDSALCFVLGAPELMARTHFIASRTYEHLSLYVLAGIIYFMITFIGVSLLKQLEKYVHIPGHTVTST